MHEWHLTPVMPIILDCTQCVIMLTGLLNTPIYYGALYCHINFDCTQCVIMLTGLLNTPIWLYTMCDHVNRTIKHAHILWSPILSYLTVHNVWSCFQDYIILGLKYAHNIVTFTVYTTYTLCTIIWSPILLYVCLHSQRTYSVQLTCGASGPSWLLHYTAHGGSVAEGEVAPAASTLAHARRAHPRPWWESSYFFRWAQLCQRTAREQQYSLGRRPTV